MSLCNDDQLGQCLPMDIFCLVMAHLPFVDRAQCLDVCPAWRERLLMCPLLWQDLDFYSVIVDPRVRVDGVVDAILQHADHSHHWPRRLCLVRSEVTIAERALTLLALHGGGSRSLSVLELTQNRASRNVLLSTLPCFGSRLTHLRLDYPNISLKTIFGPLCQACPYLTHLSVRCCSRFSNLLIPSRAVPLKLVYLDLSMLHWRYLARDMLSRLLPCLPDLRHLVMYGCTAIDLDTMFSQLERYCPHLQWIYYDPCLRCYAPTSGPWKMDPTRMGDVHVPEPNEIVVRNDICRYSRVDRLIEQSHATIRTLRLSHNMMQVDPLCYRLCLLGVPHLYELELSLNEVSESAIAALLHTAFQTLEMVALHHLDGMTDTILNILATLPRLRYLNLSECPRITSAGVRHLVDKSVGPLEYILLVYRGTSAIDVETFRYVRRKIVPPVRYPPPLF